MPVKSKVAPPQFSTQNLMHGDLLISTFMGVQKKWHTSYDLLMEAVDKVEEVIKPNTWYETDRAWFEIKSHSVSVRASFGTLHYNNLVVVVKGYIKDHRENVVGTKREAIWCALIDFITYYNRKHNNEK